MSYVVAQTSKRGRIWQSIVRCAMISDGDVKYGVGTMKQLHPKMLVFFLKGPLLSMYFFFSSHVSCTMCKCNVSFNV